MLEKGKMLIVAVLLASAILILFNSQPEAIELEKAQLKPNRIIGEFLGNSFIEGKSIIYGVFQTNVVKKRILSKRQRSKLLAKAALELVNIDDEERSRRRFTGYCGLVVTTCAYYGLTYFKSNRVTRLIGIFLPLAISIGFLTSSEKGL